MIREHQTGASIVLLTLLLAACRQADGPSTTTENHQLAEAVGPPALFSEVTSEVGLGVTAEAWPDGTYAAPEIMGPGVALLDHDGDGDLDILQLRVPRPGQPEGSAPNRLFEQGPDGKFTDVTERAGIGDAGFAQGVAVGDTDGDGDADVYFANYGPDRFYRNNGDGTFTDVSTSAGLGSDDLWSSGATFCDADADGDLDLYVLHYLDFDPEVECIGLAGAPGYCSPVVFSGVPDRLYSNAGDGTFRDVSREAGIVYADRGRSAKGLGVVCTDLTGDGRMDFYVANDREANQLWVGQAGGTFRDEAIVRGVAVNRYGKPEASMGVALGDVDRDGRPDLFVTHLFGENNTLYRASSGKMFSDRTAESGTAAADLPLTGFGCGLFDFDHDGDLDMALVNGRVRRGSPLPGAAVGEFWNRYAEPNLLFANDGTGKFVNVTERTGTFGRQIEITRGLAFGDLDGDGDLDMVLSNADNSVRVYRNDAPAPDQHWLLVRAVIGLREALGARVTLHVGEKTLLGFVLAGYSYQSSNDPRAHFGLGQASEVDAAEVQWPDGSRERFCVPGVDRQITLRKGKGERSP